MTKPWYARNPEMYEEERSQVENKYPELRFTQGKEELLIQGYYPIWVDDRVLDRYQIKLELPQDSLRGLPSLYEVGNRMPRDANHHMEPSGKACVVLPDAFWYDHPEGMTPLEFLDGPVHAYLVNQSLVERGQSDVWKEGEWRHGIRGIVDFYAAILGTEDRKTIMEYLRILQCDTVKGHWPCPCGSTKKLRVCHGGLVAELRRRIPRAVAAKSYGGLVDLRRR